MKYGQQYFKNRKATEELNVLIDKNMISVNEAKSYNISISKINKWEKEGKIFPIKNGRTKLYNFQRLIDLNKNNK